MHLVSEGAARGVSHGPAQAGPLLRPNYANLMCSFVTNLYLGTEFL